jgi:pSer/pThr/pTyr-binding forkhead associated (FHA) protein
MPAATTTPPPLATPGVAKTQLQIPSAHLLHLQTNTVMELPSNLSVIHVGKQNDQIPPDIDVSGFPNSDIVSRVHADIRVEGDAYYIEDVGSSNGTYVNHTPLGRGNRHRLRAGDRISLGKGDQVTFLFQNS